MKSKNIVHRDIKLDNILVEKKIEGLKNVRVKIADFGLSDVIKNGEIMKTRCGTPGFIYTLYHHLVIWHQRFSVQGDTMKRLIYSVQEYFYTHCISFLFS